MKQAKDLIVIAIILAIAAACITLGGCANVEMKKRVNDKVVLEATYTRWFNQKIGKFKLTTPDNWILEFENQASETEFAFRLGVMSAQLGGEGR